MRDHVEMLVAVALDDLAATTRTDDEVVARLLDAIARPQEVPRRQRRWPAVLSIAAAVVALALLIAFLSRPASNRPAPPVHSGPTQPVRVTPTATPTNSSQTVLQQCVVQLPQAWQDRMQEIPAPNVGTIEGSAGLTVLAMTPSGDAISYSNVTTQQADGSLVLVHPDRTTKLLYAIPHPPAGLQDQVIQTAQTDGRWAVFDLVDTATRTRIQAVNLGSGALVDITSVQPGTELSAPQLLNGTVYWAVTRTNLPSGGHIYGYNLASGHRATVDSGEVIDPTVLGGALEWSRGDTVHWLGSPHLPAGYPVIGKPYPLVQDGSSAAWTDWDQRGSPPRPTVMIRRPTDATPQTAYRGSSAEFDVEHQPRPFALTGNYLVYTDGSSLLALDLHTGAAIQIQPYVPGIVRAAAADGVLAIDTLGAKGGSHLSLLRPADLPEPHC